MIQKCMLTSTSTCYQKKGRLGQVVKKDFLVFSHLKIIEKQFLSPGSIMRTFKKTGNSRSLSIRHILLRFLIRYQRNKEAFASLNAESRVHGLDSNFLNRIWLVLNLQPSFPVHEVGPVTFIMYQESVVLTIY